LNFFEYCPLFETKMLFTPYSIFQTDRIRSQ
jgi:hypothetical protein